MAEIKKLPERGASLTPDSIYHMLSTLYQTAHHLHLSTTSYTKHKMLNKVYEDLQEYKDSICEYLLGIQAPKRFATPQPIITTPYSESAIGKFLDDGFKFTVSLCMYADEKGLEQLCNLASELQGVFVKGKYLNTLS
jgi:hypothetical protein